MTHPQMLLVTNGNAPSPIAPQGRKLPLQLSTRPRASHRPIRFAKRAYSQEEIATAELMLEKLRRREDAAPDVFTEPLPKPFDADRTIEAVVEKLINMI